MTGISDEAEEWSLDPRLEADTVAVTELPLCRLLLSKDARYPWLILVPMRVGVREIVDLEEADRALLMDEVAAVSRVLREVTDCDKLNVAALGNVVAQLHVHVIARFASDAAWPGPVWGAHPPVEYEADARERMVERLMGAVRNSSE